MSMSDFDKYSSLQPPTDPGERVEWLRAQEERIARLVRRELVRLIDSSTEAFVNSLTATGDMSYFDQIPTRWNMWVDDVLLEEIEGMFLAGGLTAVTTADGTLRIADSLADSWVEVVNQNAADFAKVAQNRMKDVGMTAWNDIKNKVSTSIEKGTSVEDLKTLIERNRSFSEFRADTIARTETLNAYNNGNWQGSQALGQYGPTHKYWINTGDARSRETHNTVGNQAAIPISEPFNVGGEPMMFPHSPGASAKNVVNCRCVYGELWPGDIDPNTGNPVGEVIDGQGAVQSQAGQLTANGVPVNERPPKFESVQEAETWLVNKHGKTYGGRDRSIKLGDIDLDAAQIIAEDTDFLFTKFPAVAENITQFGSSQSFNYKMGGALGRASRDQEFLFYTDEAFSGPDWFALKQQMKATQRSSSGDLAGLIHHEFGHHVHFLVEAVGHREKLGLDLLGKFPWVKNVETLKSGISPIITEVLGVKFPALGGAATKRAITSELSSYGTTNWYELIAESFAESMLTDFGRGEVRPFAAAVRAWLDEQVAKVPSPF